MYASAESTATRSAPADLQKMFISLHGRVETTSTDDRLSRFHAAGARQWLKPTRLHELALPRPAQPAPPGRVARAREQLLRHRDLFDAGKVTAPGRTSFGDLKTDFGIGVRMHGPAATPLRIELAKSNEGLAIVFSAKAAF
jgi:hypothetical protein